VHTICCVCDKMRGRGGEKQSAAPRNVNPVFDSAVPRDNKKIPMTGKMGDWSRAMKRGVGYKGRMG
jgi:hypothetical protein